MKAAACSSIYKDFPLTDALRGIAEAGYRYVEVAAMPGWCEHVDAQDAGSVKALTAALEETGLKLAAISAHCNFLEEEARKKLVDTIIMAKRLGCGLVVTSPGAGGDELRKERIHALVEIDGHCADSGVGLALEPHGELGGGALLRDLIKAAGTKSISINYDTANVIFFQALDPLDDIKATKGLLSHVHFKDKRGGKGVWDFPPLGEGELDFASIIGFLDSIGYEGYISVEIEFTPGASYSCAELDAAVKNSLTHLSKFLKKGMD